MRIGQLVETDSLYADNMLLYLEDAGPSLTAALNAIEQILPLDIGAPTDMQAPPLVRVSSMKYLGIMVTRSPEE